MRFSYRDRTYEIMGDENSWSFAEVRVKQKGDNEGDEYRTEHAYFHSMEGLVLHLFDYALRTADAESLQELVRIAQDLRRSIKEAFGLSLVA